jgi:prolyl-tRNA synthetase
MKDSYSFDRDEEGLGASYDRHIEAYDRIFDRAGLRWYRVESDVGMMGGLGAHEYMAPCPAGENEVALSGAGYAANVEIATGTAPQPEFPPARAEPEAVETPDARTIEEVSRFLAIDPATLVKSLPVVTPDGRLRLALVRGDHTLNEIKLGNLLGTEFRPATEEEIRESFGAEPGFIGPVGAAEVIADAALERGVWVTGANETGKHLRGVEPGRDFSATFADIRTVKAGDRCPKGGTIEIEPAIEVGNIFKLGTRYSVPLGATFLDEHGQEQPVVMGSYGIGPARVAAAAVEQYADEHGISWPRSIAPFQVHLVGLGKPGSDEHDLAERLHTQLREHGLETLYDDRDASPGEKFVEAELLGCPLRVVAGKRSVESGELEVQLRRGVEKRGVPLEGAAESLRELWSGLA